MPMVRSLFPDPLATPSTATCRPGPRECRSAFRSSTSARIRRSPRRRGRTASGTSVQLTGKRYVRTSSFALRACPPDITGQLPQPHSRPLTRKICMLRQCFWFSNGCAPGCERCDGSTRGVVPKFEQVSGEKCGPANGTCPPRPGTTWRPVPGAKDGNHPGAPQHTCGPKKNEACPVAKTPVCHGNKMVATNCDPRTRTVNRGANCGAPDDWYYFSPWRKPGAAPVIDVWQVSHYSPLTTCISRVCAILIILSAPVCVVVLLVGGFQARALVATVRRTTTHPMRKLVTSAASYCKPGPLLCRRPGKQAAWSKSPGHWLQIMVVDTGMESRTFHVAVCLFVPSF